MNVRERLQALLDGETLKSCDGYAVLRDGLLHSTLSTGTASIFNAGDNYFHIKPRLGTFLEAVEHAVAERKNGYGCKVRSIVSGGLFYHSVPDRLLSDGGACAPTIREILGQWELL